MERIMTADTKLRVLRIGRNWSQEELADKIGISQAAYAKLESGKTRLTIDRAQQLADVYEIEPEYFFSTEKAVHNNIGEASNSNSGYIDTYNNAIIPKETFDKLIDEKSEIIRMLKSEIAESRNERERFLQILEKLSNKL